MKQTRQLFCVFFYNSPVLPNFVFELRKVALHANEVKDLEASKYQETRLMAEGVGCKLKKSLLVGSIVVYGYWPIVVRPIIITSRLEGVDVDRVVKRAILCHGSRGN